MHAKEILACEGALDFVDTAAIAEGGVFKHHAHAFVLGFDVIDILDAQQRFNRPVLHMQGNVVRQFRPHSGNGFGQFFRLHRFHEVAKGCHFIACECKFIV